MTSRPAFLEGCRLIKRYSGNAVVDGVDITAHGGIIRAVVGENGAGKSTLMKMLTGVIRPDSGIIKVNGIPATLKSPRQAADAGIAIVHQELHLIPMQSVADNLMLARPLAGRAFRRGSRSERNYVRSWIRRVGLDIDPATPVSVLSSAQCQLLEIAKGLSLGTKTIIFDEPTSALPPQDAERLLALIEALRADDHAVLYVSHALDEVLRIADEISVLRDGRLVQDARRAQVDRDKLVRMMVDREVTPRGENLAATRGDAILTAKQVSTRHIRDLSFELHAGEIFGFAGLMGSGAQEAALALIGAHAMTSGTLTIDGKKRRFRSPHEAARAGVVMVPEERKRDGIIPDLSIIENANIGCHHRHSRRGFVDPPTLRKITSELVRQFDVRLGSIDQPIASLSGGNQQKVLLARYVQMNPRVLIVASPTRGVDIGARDTIHSIIIDLAARGTAVIVISPEIEELLSLSHRIGVFSAQRIVGTLARSEATPTQIMQLAFSGTDRSGGNENAA
jgi:ABC-type sugar transport system ATPase subunit